MNKMYLVVRDWATMEGGNMTTHKLFKSYEGASNYFQRQKEAIIELKTNYGEITDRKDYYCEFENGEYSYWHELVYIKELEVNE